MWFLIGVDDLRGGIARWRGGRMPPRLGSWQPEKLRYERKIVPSVVVSYDRSLQGGSYHMLKKVATIAGIMTLAGSSLLADFTYQETSTITGGMMMSMMKVVGAFSKQAREPIQATIAVQGDKMMHRTSNSASVIDLASGTITHIDFQKKQYSVMTFEEMKQLMEQMSQKMQKSQKGDKGEMKFKVSANATGKSKQVAGFEAKEMVMKMEMEMEATDKDSGQSQKGGMTVTTDMWIAPGVPGYQEVRDFQKRMSEKLHWTPGGNMFMSDPKVSEGMAEVYKEIARLDGMPVQQFISMGIAGQPGASGAPADGSAPPAQQQPQVERPSVGGALGGALGGRLGLGGLGRKKPADQPAAPANAPAAGGQAPGAPASLLEMTTELSSFSSNPVDASLFAVPPGFKKVDSDLKKMK
jgi:hypothetical protein